MYFTPGSNRRGSEIVERYVSNDDAARTVELAAVQVSTVGGVGGDELEG